MSMTKAGSVAKPLAHYSPYRRAGDLVYFAGVVPADPDLNKVITSYADLPAEVAPSLGATGEMSVDSKDGPITVQAWYVLEKLRQTVEDAGGTMNDIVKLTQYMTDLRDFPIYNRIRRTFFTGDPPASTVIKVVELLPTPESRLEVEAIAYIPLKR